jgi:phosphoglycolate phosphatase
LMTHDIQKIALFQGIEGLLRRLASVGVTLAVVSSNSYENIRHVLGEEMGALIAYYECGVSIFGKEAKLRKILKRSGAAPHGATPRRNLSEPIRQMTCSPASTISWPA